MHDLEHSSRVDRSENRTNLFIIATLYVGRSSHPVRVRDVSSFGARIEGSNLPPAGSQVILRRGKLEAQGVAVWKNGHRSGLSFCQPVQVSSWLPTKAGTRNDQAEQLIFGLKHEQFAEQAEPAKFLPNLPPTIRDALKELAYLQAGLIELGDKLAQDVILVATHPEIQFLDEVLQRLRKIELALQAKPHMSNF